MDWFSFRTSGYYRCVQRTFSTSQRRANQGRRFSKQRIIERITGWQTTQEISWHRSSSTWWRLGPRLRSASMNKTSWQISPSRNWVRNSAHVGSRRNAARSEPPLGTKKSAPHRRAFCLMMDPHGPRLSCCDEVELVALDGWINALGGAGHPLVHAGLSPLHRVGNAGFSSIHAA